MLPVSKTEKDVRQVNIHCRMADLVEVEHGNIVFNNAALKNHPLVVMA